jgi:CxxC motif-containing protein
MEKEIICTVCPMGCHIKVTGEGEKIESITGYSCNRGLEYGKTEFAHPVRILTSTVKTTDVQTPLVAVRSEKPVPKEKLFDMMTEIRKVCLDHSVKIHEIIIPNVCDTGVNIIASTSFNCREEK